MNGTPVPNPLIFVMGVPSIPQFVANILPRIILYAIGAAIVLFILMRNGDDDE